MDPNASTEVKYVLLNENNAAGAVDCMARAFLRENQSIATNVSYEDMMVANALYLPTLLKEDLTVVALVGNQVAGVCFNDDVALLDNISDSLIGQPKCFEPIDDLVGKQMEVFKERTLSQLREKAVAEGRDPSLVQLEPGKYLHISLLGVNEKFSRRGIGTTLIRKTLEFGKQKGYEVACAEAAGPYSQKIFERLGFDNWVEFRYHDYVYHGSKPFLSITDTEITRLVVKSI